MTCGCEDDLRALNFETMLSDPLIRMVMASDGVSLPELIAVLEVAREAVELREASAARAAMHRLAADPATI
jgi:hypothetical protein